jgi:hypothetical protein
VQLFGAAFWLPKKGNHCREYEDAFAPRRLPNNKEIADFRVAIADGATETSFSGLWARLLVASYARGHLSPEGFESALQKLQERWRREVGKKNLPWYAEAKVRAGAAAAFVGLSIEDHKCDQGDPRNWSAIALGDCCLVHVRLGRVIERFPLRRASEFSNTPYLLSTNPTACRGWQDQLKQTSGIWLSDDSFYLMSDALAAWFMHEEENGRAPWEVMHDFGTVDGPPFSNWIGKLRSENSIRNDDVTLVRLDLVA